VGVDDVLAQVRGPVAGLPAGELKRLNCERVVEALVFSTETFVSIVRVFRTMRADVHTDARDGIASSESSPGHRVLAPGTGHPLRVVLDVRVELDLVRAAGRRRP
jgi:hypothetical protein